MKFLFDTFLYTPLYNFLVWIINHVPHADLGISVIILTIIVRMVLYPISKNAQTQIQMQDIQPDLNLLKQKYKDDQKKLAEEMMKFYKEKKIKPFSGILLLLIQILIILALYYVFFSGGWPNINMELLYSFVSAPENIGLKFLGIFDVTKKSIILALLAGITQFIQLKTMQVSKNKNNNTAPDTNDKTAQVQEMMELMQKQMKYIFPGMMIGISYGLGSVVAIYFITGNIFSTIQGIYLKKKFTKKD